MTLLKSDVSWITWETFSRFGDEMSSARSQVLIGPSEIQ